jgi:DNA polymerase/3'-5' exonuclease PolX
MVRAHAKQQGYKLNEFGLYDLRKAGARVQGLDSEEKIMAHIGMKYIPMNKRR